MKRKQWIVAVAVVAVLAALVVWGRHRIHFDFAEFGSQLALIDWRRIAFGLALIYGGYFIRAARWAMLMRHNRKVRALSLVGTQVMGFTAVALIGRVADLVRPYLVTKKTGEPLSSQIAVYIVERLSDMGSIALYLSVAVLAIPKEHIDAAIAHSKSLVWLSQHTEPWAPAFAFRYGGLVMTLCGAAFLVGIRLGGEVIASTLERAFGMVSENLGNAVGHKIRTFRTGLDTIRSFSDFATLLVLSLGMWFMIATAYFQTLRAFSASPQLAAITPQNCILLMVISGGASVVQLPVLGWFSQIGIVAAALRGFFGVSWEASSACAAMLLVVTFLATIPVGLIWAQFENVNLRSISTESEHAGEEIEDKAPAVE